MLGGKKYFGLLFVMGLFCHLSRISPQFEVGTGCDVQALKNGAMLIFYGMHGSRILVEINTFIQICPDVCVEV